MSKKLFLLLLCASISLNAKELSLETLEYQKEKPIIITNADLFATFVRESGWKVILAGVTAAASRHILNHPSLDITKNPLLETLPKMLGTVATSISIMYALFLSMTHDYENLYQAAYDHKLAILNRELIGEEEPGITYLSDEEHEDSPIYELYPDRIKQDDNGNEITDPMGNPITQPC